MPTAKAAISIDPDDIRRLDELVERDAGPSRSKLIQNVVAEKLLRLKQVGLSEECATLKPAVERAEAEQWLSGEAVWPQY